MPEGDPLAALDARINVLRTIRASAPRFSDAYWEADDTLAWLRVLRDDVSRTGRIRGEVMAFLETPPTAFLVESSFVAELEPLADPSVAIAVGLSSAGEDDATSEPVALRRSRRRQLSEAAEPVGAA